MVLHEFLIYWSSVLWCWPYSIVEDQISSTTSAFPLSLLFYLFVVPWDTWLSFTQHPQTATWIFLPALSSPGKEHQEARAAVKGAKNCPKQAGIYETPGNREKQSAHTSPPPGSTLSAKGMRVQLSLGEGGKLKESVQLIPHLWPNSRYIASLASQIAHCQYV